MSISRPAAVASIRAPGARARRVLLAALCALAAACGSAGSVRPSSAMPVASQAGTPRPLPSRAAMVAALKPPAPLRGARLAVQPHVRVDGDLGGDANQVVSRTRAVLDNHPDLTTDVEGGRAFGLSLILLDAVTTCSFRDRDKHVELGCAVRFSLADRRGRLVAAWSRSVTVTGPHGAERSALVDDAVGHALRGLPEQILRTHDSLDPAAVALVPRTEF